MEDDSNEEHYARLGLVGGAGFKDDMKKQWKIDGAHTYFDAQWKMTAMKVRALIYWVLWGGGLWRWQKITSSPPLSEIKDTLGINPIINIS
jgi:hypothetical protein